MKVYVPKERSLTTFFDAWAGFAESNLDYWIGCDYDLLFWVSFIGPLFLIIFSWI